MTEATESLVLGILRRIQASRERTEADVADMKVRTSALEQLGGRLLARHGQMVTLLGTFNQRMGRFAERRDRFEPHRLDCYNERLGRIEQRLDSVGS